MSWTSSTPAFGMEVDRLQQSLDKQNTMVQMKEDNKTVALGTSKMNYMDPRITVPGKARFVSWYFRYFQLSSHCNGLIRRVWPALWTNERGARSSAYNIGWGLQGAL